LIDRLLVKQACELLEHENQIPSAQLTHMAQECEESGLGRLAETLLDRFSQEEDRFYNKPQGSS